MQTLTSYIQDINMKLRCVLQYTVGMCYRNECRIEPVVEAAHHMSTCTMERQVRGFAAITLTPGSSLWHMYCDLLDLRDETSEDDFVSYVVGRVHC